eukprot:TRINITY_DN6423_c0_g1_i1.p1 TRINITY_DN6423_c0_g1~~TRINITY_DN6423_c0_g1_i1.p1  ORF type:complete len:583 (-),score=303.57 TRINITY_DN6423_c0_g1_i1:115-1863(-)
MSGQTSKKTLFASNPTTAVDYDDENDHTAFDGLEDDVDLIAAAAEAAAEELFISEAAADTPLTTVNEQTAVVREEINSVPPTIVEYLQIFQQAVQQSRTTDISRLYDEIFRRHSEKFFPSSTWPTQTNVAPFLDENDELFMALYHELFYRHIYSRLSVSFEDRQNSWNNYLKLFSFFLVEEVGKIVDLPVHWLWDMVDEFLYQFQEFSETRAALLEKGDEEQLKHYRANPQVWDATKVTELLKAFVDKSNILPTEERECLTRLAESHPSPAQQEAATTLTASTGEVPAPTSSALLKKIAFFAMVGLLRLNCLLGDYTAAINSVNFISLSKNPSMQVIGCHFNLHYYLGFSYMMLKRYSDAIRVFVSVISFINRARQINSKHEKILKRADRIYGLLAICMTFNSIRIHDVVLHKMREKFADRLPRLQKGDESCFKDLFVLSAPRIITPTLPTEGSTQEKTKAAQQMDEFLEEVREQTMISNLRSFLKLYSTLSLAKLVKFLEVDEETARKNLENAKKRARSVVWSQGPLSSGTLELTTGDIDFEIEKDMISVTSHKPVRRVGDYFSRNTIKFEEILRSFDSSR